MDAETCAACGTKPRYGFPFKACSECKRSFHSKKCLKLISIGNQQTIHLCACCELKRREREIKIENKRHSSSSNTRPVASFISREVAWVKKVYGCARMGKITRLGSKIFSLGGREINEFRLLFKAIHHIRNQDSRFRIVKKNISSAILRI